MESFLVGRWMDGGPSEGETGVEMGTGAEVFLLLLLFRKLFLSDAITDDFADSDEDAVSPRFGTLLLPPCRCCCCCCLRSKLRRSFSTFFSRSGLCVRLWSVGRRVDSRLGLVRFSGGLAYCRILGGSSGMGEPRGSSFPPRVLLEME